jgi:hypothetical protein
MIFICVVQINSVEEKMREVMFNMFKENHKRCQLNWALKIR